MLTTPLFTRLAGALVAALLAMSGLVLATAAPAFACRCDSADIEKQSNRADAVFVAEVGDVVEVGKQFEYALTVTEVFKGSAERDTVVASHQQATACGLGKLRPGTEYVFLVTGDAPPYAADSCGGSGPVSAKRLAEVETVLGPAEAVPAPEPPAPTMTKVEDASPPSVSRLAAPGGAAVIIGLLGLVVVGRRARR